MDLVSVLSRCFVEDVPPGLCCERIQRVSVLPHPPTRRHLWLRGAPPPCAYNGGDTRAHLNSTPREAGGHAG